MATEIQIQPRPAGIYLPELDLWLDPRGRQKRAFISHAHADHHSRPEQAICSFETAHLLHRRFGLKKDSLTVIAEGETMKLNGFELSLHPAGHVIGSSMLHLRRLSDHQTLLFTGDFKTIATRTCPAAPAVKADTLIIETTYGRPEYVFPSRQSVERSIVNFIHSAFDSEEVPVLCAYSLGKAQELSALLAKHSIPFQAHPSVIEMNDACRELGTKLPEAAKIQSPIPAKHAILCPPSAIRSTVLRRLKNKQTAMISGWGIHPNARYRYRVDEVFPLSDHADYHELLDFVAAVDPSKTYTVHGSTREFAADLRAAGRQAWSLFTDDQLELIPDKRERVSAPTDTIAEAFASDPKEVARAHMLTGDLGKTAHLAKQDELDKAKLQIGTALKVMLASPAPDAVAIHEKLADQNGDVWLEDKFDGIRAQLHKNGNNIHLFSRDLRSLDSEFPELIKAATELPDCLLDGEIIAFDEGKKLNFFDLQKRLGKKQKNRDQTDLFQPREIPVRFIAFDLLAHEKESFWQKPLRERRAQLDAIDFKAPFEVANHLTAANPKEIDSHFKQARARANEGLIAKDPESPYQFGRRGQSWLKLKKAEVTLDCLVTRAQQGHGKRAGLLSDYTFAVRDDSNGQLRIIGKAYSGLTDAEIEELTEHFTKTTIETKRRVHSVEPQIVLEIAFDSIRPSKRHDSGLAMRFPRIKAIRRDKTPEEIDTLQFARTLAK